MQAKAIHPYLSRPFRFARFGFPSAVLCGGSCDANQLGSKPRRIVSRLEGNGCAFSQFVKPDILKRPSVKEVGLPVRPQEMPDAAIPLQVRDRAVHESGH